MMKSEIEDILKKAPFNLDAAALNWVQQTYDSLSLDEKVGQLFNTQSMGSGDGVLERPRSILAGGVTRFFSGDFAAEQSLITQMQREAKVPLLVSADLEGSLMSLPFGTEVPNPLSLAAIDDVEDTRKVSKLMAQEARAVGINWTFTPVLDINAAFRSPIVATRGYGSDPAHIKRHALAQLEVFQAEGLAATVKHWPGEGYDDRDQHLLTTVIPLSVADWRESFGALYRAAIDAGVKSVMSAHIAFPAYVRELDAEADVLEQYQPASISKHLNQTLLRDELGFNGLVVSDSTSMAGLSSVSARSEHLAEVIESGCDMILFGHDPLQDVAIIKAALQDGRLSQGRFEAVLMRILGLKASLGLHLPREAPEMPEARAAKAMIAPITQKAPTLVKDVQNLLPMSVQKHKKIYIYTTGEVSPLMGSREMGFCGMLRQEGFEVTLHDAGQPGMRLWAEHDLILYVMAEETLLTRERIFMNWAGLTGYFGAAMERPWHEVPCALISFGYPYYLYDTPRMPCVVNAYMSAETAQAAVIECLMGREEFSGVSPVDAFCGQPEARY